MSTLSLNPAIKPFVRAVSLNDRVHLVISIFAGPASHQYPEAKQLICIVNSGIAALPCNEALGNPGQLPFALLEFWSSKQEPKNSKHIFGGKVKKKRNQDANKSHHCGQAIDLQTTNTHPNTQDRRKTLQSFRNVGRLQEATCP